MYLFKHFCHHAVTLVGVLMVCASSLGHADNLADANKLFRHGKLELALATTNSYLADKPKDPQARFLKGLILTEQGNITDAIKIFSGLTEDYPGLPEPYNNLAVLYASQGHYEQAQKSLEMAIRTHPSYATAHENLGDIYAKMASQAYDRALQLDKGNAATQTKLAMIQDLFSSKNAQAQSPDKADTPEPSAGKQPKVEPNPQPATAAKPEAEKPLLAKPATVKPEGSPKKSAAKPKDDPASEVIKAVYAWAAAWSAQNVDEYLSFYSKNFSIPGSENRSSWEATRHDRLSKPEYIRVKIGKPTVKLIDDSHATIRFRQSYDANHFKATGNKTLLMVRADGKWLIQEELAK